MKKLLLKSMLAIFVISILGFSTSETYNNKLCGPFFYADNSNSGIAPEIIHVTISNSTGSYTYYVCCGNDGFLGQWGGSGPYTIRVAVESDWSGPVASIGVRYYGGTTIQCQQYTYGQGYYTFYLSGTGCDAFEIFVSPSISC